MPALAQRPELARGQERESVQEQQPLQLVLVIQDLIQFFQQLHLQAAVVEVMTVQQVDQEDQEVVEEKVAQDLLEEQVILHLQVRHKEIMVE